MPLWLVRAGSNGEREQDALQNNLAIIGWSRGQLGDLSNVKDRGELRKLLESHYPDANKNRITNFTAQIWGFIRGIQENDLVVLPSKFHATIAIGKVTGPYNYRTDLSPEIRHTRSVQWIRSDIPRTAFQQDLLYSFGAFMTVCEIRRNNAEERVRAVLAGKPDSFNVLEPEPKIAVPHVQPEAETIVRQNLERAAYDQIQEAINIHFKGHGLARLVDSVLQAEGYTTYFSQPGPDGGTDILAGNGPFGFDNPRICVQVKSANSPLDVKELRELKGVMDSYSATQGLLVSWGGFKDTLRKESKQSFFNVRLWDSDDLIQSILRNYDRLSGEIKTELPLKRIWSLVTEEEED